MKLNDFSPAQTLVLTNPNTSKGMELIKYDFLYLLYRGVIKIYREWRLPHPRHSQKRMYTVLKKGDFFDTYLKTHKHNPITNVIANSGEGFQVSKVLKSVFEDCKNQSNYKHMNVFRPLQKDNYFTRMFNLFGIRIYIRTAKGTDLRNKYQTILDDAEMLLPRFAKSNPIKAREIVDQLGPNIVLLKCFNDTLINDLKICFSDNVNISKPDEFSAEMKDNDFETMFCNFAERVEKDVESYDESFDFESGELLGSELFRDYSSAFQAGGALY